MADVRMTKQDAHAAARALLDAMAGTTEPDIPWTPVVGEEDDDWGVRRAGEESGQSVAQMVWEADAAYIARACPARLGPVLRALMGEEE